MTRFPLKYILIFLITASICSFTLLITKSKHSFNLLQSVNNLSVQIDCSKPAYAQQSMIGFLHSFNDKTPPAHLITDLSPKYWRFSSRGGVLFKRLGSFKTKPIFILSDIYQYPISGLKNWINPSTNYNFYIDSVIKVITKHRIAGQSFIYDIWNEPTAPAFWNGTKENFFLLFKKTHDAIRSLPNGNNTLITGPSSHYFDKDFIQRFLDFCLANHIKLDVLSWHETRTGSDIVNVEKDLNYARLNWVNNPKYAALKIRSVQINEMLFQSEQFSATAILGYFYYLEKGKANGACKSCWPESDNINNCFNNSLDGLLTPNNEPRAAWWAYKYYNSSLKIRIASQSNNTNLVSFASANNGLDLLLAYFGYTGQKDDLFNIAINLNKIKSLKYFSLKKIVNIQVFDIPDSDKAPVLAPKVILQKSVSLNSGTELSFVLPNIKLTDAYYVKFN